MPLRTEYGGVTPPSVTRRRIKTWNVVAAGLTLVLLAGTYQAAVHTAYPGRRMPDGGWVGLAGVTWKRPKTVLVGSVWDRSVAAFQNPGGLKDWSATLPADDSPTVWLKYSRHYFWRDRQAPSEVLRSPCGDEWFAKQAASYGQLEGAAAELDGSSFPVFPRRHRTLTLRVYQNTGGWVPSSRRWVDIPFANPAYQDYPIWKPEPFPVSRISGDLKVELTCLHTGVEFPEGKKPSSISFLAATLATFRVTHNGTPDPEWVPVEVSYVDATGNHLGGYEDRLTRYGDEIGFPIYGQLPSDESAWKVKAEFSRARDRSVNPDHHWTAKHVPIPDQNSQDTWQSTRLADGVSLLSQVTSSPSNNQVYLKLQLQAAGKTDLRAVLRGRGNTGYTFTEKIAEWTETRGGEPPTWRIALPASTRYFDLEVSAYRSRFFEFLVRPVRVK